MNLLTTSQVTALPSNLCVDVKESVEVRNRQLAIALEDPVLLRLRYVKAFHIFKLGLEYGHAVACAVLVAVLVGLVEVYEYKHGVTINDTLLTKKKKISDFFKSTPDGKKEPWRP